MKVEEKKRDTATKRANEVRHLRVVPSRSEASRPARPDAGPRPARDGFSASGEREEATSSRVSNILQGLQGGEENQGGPAQARGGGEGWLDDVVDGVKGFFDNLNGHDRQNDRLAEDREDNATVAVIDYFGEEGKDPEHGDIVESILQDNSGLSDEDIQRYRAGGVPGINGLAEASPEDFGQALDDYVEGWSTGILNGSSDAIEDILADDETRIRTINQSLGAPESRIAGEIANRLESDAAFRERFLEYAGLDSDASEREVMQALVDEVSDSRRNNENIQEAKERYDNLVREAYDRGITTIDSSGNYGAFARELEALGVETDDQFHTDVLNNPLVLSVGGTDSKGTTGLEDDEVSGFTSPRAGADIAAQGSNVTTDIDGEREGGNGTSYAAPQVAAAAAVLAERYPELSAAEIRAILLKTAENPGLDADLVGAGIVQQDEALDLAEQLAA